MLYSHLSSRRTQVTFLASLAVVGGLFQQVPLAAVAFSTTPRVVSSRTSSNLASIFPTTPNSAAARTMASSSTSLEARTRGLEQRRESATPTAGDMTLYLKAGEDGVSVGDCPFAHYVRMVLEEKGLEYSVKPCTQETKPDWLIENYEGKMPALRHQKECYIDSSVIAEYLEFFFSKDGEYPKLSPPAGSEEILDGFFPAVAQFIKMIDNADEEKIANLRAKLQVLDDHLKGKQYLTGDDFSLLDCRLVPQLYAMYTCIDGYKDGLPNVAEEFPNLHAYYERSTARPSFQNSVYPKETCLWGWGNARGN